MRVRLTRKLAERLNGIDLTGRAVGDVLDLPDREALLLVSEQWATVETSQRRARARAAEFGIPSSAAAPTRRKPEGRRSSV